MKTELTKEQSQHLIDLGIPQNNANWKVIGMDVDYSMPLESLIEKHQVEPCFSLNLLLEILPKVMHKEGLAYDYNLEMCWREDEKKWLVTYDSIGDNMGAEKSEELIDALYELLCWVIENNYLKTE